MFNELDQSIMISEHLGYCKWVVSWEWINIWVKIEQCELIQDANKPSDRTDQARPTHSRWKATMLSCDTTWLVWPDRRVVSRAVPMHLNVRCDCLSIVSIVASSTSIATQPILPM